MSDSAVNTSSKEKTEFLESLERSNGYNHIPVVPALAAKGKLLLDTLTFPNSKTEDWKYSRTAKIAANRFQLQSADAGEIAGIPDFYSHKIRMVNGEYAASHSAFLQENEGVIICDLRSAAERYPELIEQYVAQLHQSGKDIFSALNAAWHQNGLFVYVPKNTTLNHPIELLLELKGSNVMMAPRNLIVLDKGAKAEITLRAAIHADNASFINGVSEIFVADNAEITFTHFEFENRNCFQIWTHDCKLSRDSRAHFNTLSSSSDWIRNNLNIAITGSNAEANLNGAYQIAGKEHVDNHTCVDHISADCQSNELYKGMVDEKGSGVFNGKVFVRQDAQRTNAYQSNSNLVLSDDAVMNSKPELEIYADDVKCSHGSTTGQFDEDAVFYLRARGIAENDARKLLVKAFVGEVIEKLGNEALRNFAYDKMGLSEIAGNIILE